MEGSLTVGSTERRNTVRIRRIMYSLGWLSALAIALSAGWKVNQDRSSRETAPAPSLARRGSPFSVTQGPRTPSRARSRNIA